MIPGEILFDSEAIELNSGRQATRLTVSNTGDRPVQVGSHYRFSEVNSALSFDRQGASNRRLDIAAGTSVRFEAGQAGVVQLIAFVAT